MDTQGVVMPKNKISYFLMLNWLLFLHWLVGCRPFYKEIKNKNGKPFKRVCRCCNKKQHRVNGKWRNT